MDFMIFNFLSNLTRKTKTIILACLSLLILYALAGLLLVPYLLKKEITKSLDNTFQTKSSIEAISFNPFTFELTALNFNLPDKTKSLLKFKRLYIDLDLLPLITKEIKIQSLQLNGVDGQFIIHSDGKNNWALPKTKSNTQVQDLQNKENKKSPWTLTLEKIQLENNQFFISDRTNRSPLNLPLGPINLTAGHISTVIGKTSSLDNLTLSLGNRGYLKLNGELGLTPVFAKIKFEARKFPLEFITAYLSNKTNLSVKNGTIDLDGGLNYQNSKITFDANSSLNNVVIIDEITKTPAFSWTTLKLNDFKFKTAPMGVRINEIEVSDLDTKIQLKSNGTLNYKDFMRQSPPEVEPKDKNPFEFSIQNFKINRGNLDFSDLQIKPHFQAHIDGINGSLGPITASNDSKITIDLEGKVEAAGKFKSKGYVLPGEKSDLNLDMNFSNIELTTFTPYAGRFAGYEIKKGKLFLDLNYTLQNRRIKGKNNVRLDNFTLGDKVESEHSTNLPVKFVLSLMKDRKGQIKFKLPVEGDVNSPSFSLGNLIWTALKNMIVNIVAAPFDFLSSLVSGGDKLQLIQFEAGHSGLAIDQANKLDQLSKILEERPELSIDLQGLYQKNDLEVLKANQKPGTPVSAEELDSLKSLALARGQTIQTALIERKIDAERLYLLSGSGSIDDTNPPQVKLSLKTR